MWWYGGGYGCRPLIETLPIVALPLAALIAYVGSIRYKVIKIAGSLVLIGFITLNMFQSYQFILGIFPGDYMSKEIYWKIFGQADPDKTKKQP